MFFIDRDECSDSQVCDLEVSYCLNTREGYVCQCKPGYANVDNFTCRICKKN